jgi:hypothetical protein
MKENISDMTHNKISTRERLYFSAFYKMHYFVTYSNFILQRDWIGEDYLTLRSVFIHNFHQKGKVSHQLGFAAIRTWCCYQEDSSSQDAISLILYSP